MNVTGFVQPKELSDDDKARFEEILKRACVITTKWAEHFFGERAIRKFRLHYFSNTWKGKKEISDEDRAVIDSIPLLIDTDILPGFVRVASTMALNFSRKNLMIGAQFDDCFQDACMAISDAVWTYNGTSTLSTHIGTVILNRFTDRWRIDHKRCDNIVQSQIESEDNPIVAVDENLASPEQNEATDMMFQAARDDFDKALVQAYLDNVPGFRTVVAQQFKRTRAAGQQRWAAIVARIRVIYAREAA